MKKTLWIVMITIALVMIVLPTAAMAEGSHSHTLCNNSDICSNLLHSSDHGEVVTWTPWTETDALPSADEDGSYYLTTDVTIPSTWVVSANVELDLNGHTVKLVSDGTGSVIRVAGGGVFTLSDCDGGGNIIGTQTVTGVYLESGAVFSLYGGNITGKSNGESAAGDSCCGGVYSTAGSTFNMYGGTIGGVYGGVDWSFQVLDKETGKGKLIIRPTTKDPNTLEIYKYTGKPYPVGWWREMVDYSGANVAYGVLPYEALKSKITSLEIREGVIHIGSFVMDGFTLEQETLVIPSTVRYIGQQGLGGTNAGTSMQMTKLVFAEGSQLKCIC